jgi:pyroglutamyl-peptidase
MAHWTTGDDATAFTVRVTGAGGRELAHTEVPHSRFTGDHIYQNVPIELTSWDGAAFDIEITWPGEHPVRIDYLELFRARRGVAIEPASGVLTADRLQLEILDPPPGYRLELGCGELSLTERLADQLASGDATRTDTDFRSIVDAPAALIADCPRPTRLLAEVVADGRSRAAARVTYYDAVPPCSFPADSDRPRVLLTGFEPFPADGRHDNSSEEAVTRFDPGALDIDLMTLILPVEWQAAADLVAGTIDRCRPDVVIGFGQGRSAVDVETIAYNVMDSSDVAGGVPDNRGLVHGGTPIVDGGAAELATGLPAAAIVDRLRAAGIAAGPSDDPGRYICNNVFYAIMTAARTADFVGGFIHLPYIREVGADQAAMLQQTVDTAVRLALE